MSLARQPTKFQLVVDTSRATDRSSHPGVVCTDWFQGSKVPTATQAEADVFYADGYLAKKITVKSEFSPLFNSIVAKLD